MNADVTISDDRFAFFTREELLEQQCMLLENELDVMSEELAGSREKIATLVLMWSGVRSELRRTEAELNAMKYELQTVKALEARQVGPA
ncbi:hypothetical protein KSS94_09460 [Pseudomonas fakonensis]|uniref:Cell division protein ZapB n=1 Tax=Pseudomonas fakonensis TaxID=2842355 RepID=A0ABX8NAD8_9PSED|nr:hypothetical protein [Pseudomonas fakonensis]QXH53319.1 hypothetical protein KSS94_09460 [Pseudomonas fakonensis]